MQLNELQFYHAIYNQKFFENKLESAIICFGDLEYEALFEETTEPFIITFNSAFEEDNDKKYATTILLHEMIHQYCFENNIEDINENGEHNANFAKVAEKYGLMQNGYKLSAELEKEITEIIETYEILTKNKNMI